MAMLAEPRRKQKLSHDPRNRAWSDDQGKFGQRMLEKMGWQSGKGLGANLDGSTNHIKVSLKNNTLGVGCTASYDDNWIAHQDDFNDVLATLNQDHSKEDSRDQDKATKTDESTSKSLEEKSKKSRSRLHKKKFTRGKDLSRYGATDINCILGVRANRSTPSTPKMISANNSDSEAGSEKATKGEEEANNEREDTSHGITTIIQNTSVQDYFAKKMAELKKGRQSPKPASKDSESDEKGSNKDSVQNDEVDLESKKEKRKKKKSKRKDSSDDDNVLIDMMVESVANKKLKKSSKTKRSQVNVVSDHEDGGDANGISDIEDEQPRRKKCKKKDRDEEPEKVHIEEVNCVCRSKKSKKKKKRKSVE